MSIAMTVSVLARILRSDGMDVRDMKGDEVRATKFQKRKECKPLGQTIKLWGIGGELFTLSWRDHQEVSPGDLR